MSGERLTRFGTDPESAERLATQAAAAAGPTEGRWRRSFRVHDTPSRRDPLHRTVDLPVPVTQEIADAFNRLFGQG